MLKKIYNNSADKLSLALFLKHAGSSLKTFRYFSKRPLESIENHYCTILCFNEFGLPVGYGHLELQDETVWLGICVAQNHLHRGYGSKIMINLLKESKFYRLNEISLQVDKENNNAISLYKKFNFYVHKEIDEKYFLMKRTNDV